MRKSVRIPGITSRFDALAAEQSEIRTRVDDLTKVGTVMIKVYGIRQKRAEVSKIAWIFAGIFLALSVIMISLGTWSNVIVSSQQNSADSYHREAQTARVDAIEQLLEDFEPMSQVNSLGQLVLSKLTPQDLSKIMGAEGKATQSSLTNADKTVKTANQLDSQADNLTDGSSTLQLISQITLGIGSALFGAVLGWIITLAFAALRSKKEIQS